jgi:hypothetical protein
MRLAHWKMVLRAMEERPSGSCRRSTRRIMIVNDKYQALVKALVL